VKKIVPLCCFTTLFFQLGYTQTGRIIIPLHFDVSGYNNVPFSSDQGILLDTVACIKTAMNVNEIGALTYIIPIEVIKGNNDFHPNISLGYNSQSGDGIAGWGWNIIGLSTITQGGTSQIIDGITRGSQYNGNDPFYLDGQRLLKTSSTDFVTEKYSKIKITKQTEPSEYNFVVQYTDGKVAKYKELTEGQHYVSLMTDPFDNEIHYTYTVTNNIVYINTISYGGNSVANDKFFVNFVYANKTVQSATLYRNNRTYRHSKYLTEIKVSTSYLSQNDGLYRKYLLHHDKIKENTTERLIKVEVGNQTESFLKPLHFSFNNVDFGDIVSTSSNVSRPKSEIKELGDVVIGDFYGTGELSPLYEVKNKHNKYDLYSPKTNNFVFVNGVSKNSKKYFSGKVLYDDNVLSESDNLIIVDTQYLSAGEHNGLIDQLNFVCKNLSTNKTKMITIELPGVTNTLGPQYDGHQCQDANGTQICPNTTWHRNMTERDIIVGDFNNDGLTDVFILQPRINNNRNIYFFELGKYNQDTFTLHSITGFNGHNIHYSAYTKIRNIFPFEFDGDGIPELLFIRQSFEQSVYKLHYYVVKFDYIQKKLMPIVGQQNILLDYSDKDTPIILGDFNGDGLTDFITPQKTYKIENSSISSVLNQIKTDNLFWWQYISTGTGFIKTQKNYTQQGLAYIAPSQRDIIKKSSSFQNFWSGPKYKYQYTEYGSSHIIATDIDNDGKTDLIAVRKFGKINYNSGELSYSKIENFNITGNEEHADKIFFYKTKTLPDGKVGLKKLNDKVNIHNTKISPFSLIVNYTDYDYLNTYKSGVFIHDIITEKEHRYVINNDNFNETLIREINNGSSVVQKIEYKPMLERTNDRKDDVYTTSGQNIEYPYYVYKNQGTHYLTHKIHTIFDDNIITREYRYQDGIQNLSGKGFQGFRKTFVSDPYQSKLVNGKYSMKKIFEGHFWTTNQYDPLMENALVTTYYGSLDSNSVFSKTKFTNQKFNKTNNRYLIVPVAKTGYDLLQNTTISKIYDYDLGGDLLLNKVITNFQDVSSSVEKYFYKPPNTNNGKYFFGQINKIETTTLREGNSFFTKQENEFNNNGTISKIKKYSNNSSAIVTEYTYHPFGEIHTEKIYSDGIAPLTTTYQYDQTNRFVKKIISPEGLVTNYTIDALGRVLSEMSPLNRTTTYKYDSWGDLKQVTDYLNKKTTLIKGDASGEPLGYYSLTTIKEGGTTTVSIMDVFDREIKTKTKTINDQWVVKKIQYDLFGRKIAESEPYIQGENVLWNTIEYDEINRPVKQTTFNGKIITTCYEGNKVTVEDGHKKNARWVDATGLVYKHQDQGGTIFYKYYPNGTLKEADYDGIKTHIEIDDWGNKKKLIDPSAGTYQYQYDNFGRIKKEINPKGGITQYSYDAFGKLISENTHSSSENTNITKSYMYDAITKLPTQILGTYNGQLYIYTTFYNDPFYRITGKKEQTSDFVHQTSLTYNSFGRIDQTEIKTILNNPNHTSMTKIKNHYDNNGILIKQSDGLQSIWEINSVNGHGSITQMQYGNGYVLETTYNNSDLRLEKIKHSKNGQSVLNIIYNYHPTKGVLLSRNNLVFNKNETYTYDDLDRLLEERVNSLLTKQYTYDKKGRMTYNSDIGKLNFTNQNYKLKSVNLNNNGVNWDVHRGFAQTTYNAFKNPNQIILDGKDKISYQYSILKTRSKAHYGSLDAIPTQRPNTKLYSADQTIEVIKTGNTTKLITYLTGDPYMANYIKVEQFVGSALRNTQKYFLHRDNQGTILAVTKATNNGAVVEKRYFDAWGNLKGAKLGNSNVFVFSNSLGWIPSLLLDRGYTGHEHLVTVGLIHTNGRIYDPLLRRFTSPDNFVQDGFNTQNYNRYAYVLNNPLLYTDPSGEFIMAAAIGLGVAILMNGLNNSINKTPFWYGAGKSGTIGAVSGAINAGIGQITANFLGQTAQSTVGGTVASAFIGNFMPTIDIPIGDWNINVSPAIAFGNATGVGVNVGVSYSDGNWSFSAGVGVMYYGDYNGFGKNGLEIRKSILSAWDDGKAGVSLGTNFWGGDFKQQTGVLGLKLGEWGMMYENDGGFGIKNLGLGDGDSYRTAALSLSYKDYSVGFNLFTGYREDAKKGTYDKNFQTDDFGRKYNYGFVKEEKPYYRLGALTFGYKGYKFGVNSEHIRHAIQDRAIHGAIHDAGFKNQSWDWNSYFQYKTPNKFTSW